MNLGSINSSAINSSAVNSGASYSNNTYGSGFGPEWRTRFAQADAVGEVITFYSYKGGTGRTMALTSCAGLIAEHWPSSAKPILLIDFDLEAPGLHQYLRDHVPLSASLEDRPGTLELFEALKRQVLVALRDGDASVKCLDDEACYQLIAEFDFTPYLVQTTLAPIWLIKAGCFDKSYAKRLSRMRWQSLFKAAPGIFRALAARWANDYAFTMIDARTGLSDTSGICTMLLPDVLTVVFTPNRQSLSGVTHMVREAQSYRAKSADLRPLRVYPLPSRVEQTSEDARETWRRGVEQHPIFGQVDGYQPLFEQIFYVDGSADLTQTLDGYFDAVQVPHSPDYAYGERLCFGPQTTKDRLSLRSAFEAFLPWLTSGAQPWESPFASLEKLYLTQWLLELAPPASDDADAFEAWLNKVRVNTEGGATAGYFVLRDALSKLGGQASAFVDLEPLLPQGVLIKALALMHGEEWQAASALFTQAIDNVRSHGLPANWEQVPMRWLAYQRATQPLSHLEPWLKTGCQTSMEDWVDAAKMSRHERWQWMAKLGEVLGELGVTSEKRKALGTELLIQRQAVLGLEHADTLVSMNNLAETLRAVGDLTAARTLQEQLLAVQQRVLGPEHADTLTCMNNLAGTISDMGDLPGARTMQEEVLAIRRRVQGDENSDTLTSMNNLAETLRAMGDLSAAHALQQRAFEISRRVLGPVHLDTVRCMSNLAATLLQMGELPAARVMQEQALIICREAKGSEHPDTLTVLNNLASTLGALGEWTDARVMQEQVLGVRERVLGADHHDTLTTMGNLALTLRALGDLSGAHVLQVKVFETSKRVLDPEHPDMLAAMSNLASTLGDLGDFSAARDLQERALDVCRRVFGLEHPDTLNCMNNLAVTLHAGNELHAARDMLERVVEISRRVLGAEHARTLSSMNNLAGVLRALGDAHAALAIHEQVLAIRQRVQGPEHIDALTTMNNMATTHYAIGNLTEARVLQEQVLGIRQRLFGPEHPSTLGSMSNLAFTRHAMGELHEARAMQEEVLEIRHRVLGPDHPNTLSSFSNLVQASQKAGDSEAVSNLMTRYPDLASTMFKKLSGSSAQFDTP